VTRGPSAADPPVAALLERIAAGRGYVLPHHRFLAEHAPRALSAYDALYRAITLEPGALEAADRERVWMALLAIHRKFSWRIHLQRARQAGLSDAEVAECLALAAYAAGDDVLAFGAAEWSAEVTPAVLAARADTLFDAARGRMAAGTARLVLTVCHATRGDQAGVRRQLVPALHAGITRAALAEGFAYVLLECGVNALIEAVETWSAAAAAGECPPPYDVDGSRA
jgi:alkylhydroperoxidase/carboxymuconolactone decarboxylase family protein YurZ